MDWGDALYALFLMGLMAALVVVGWKHAQSGAVRRNRLRIRGKNRHRVVTAQDLWGPGSTAWGGGPSDGGGDCGDGGGDGGGGGCD